MFFNICLNYLEGALSLSSFKIKLKDYFQNWKPLISITSYYCILWYLYIVPSSYLWNVCWSYWKAPYKYMYYVFIWKRNIYIHEKEEKKSVFSLLFISSVFHTSSTFWLSIKLQYLLNAYCYYYLCEWQNMPFPRLSQSIAIWYRQKR